ncbi:MAG: DNA-3-methyladenine glycosylase I [Fimbriimonas sp.]|nr:DNA-3-methyladenine glycosylase I [Fimbriimonas sp.]
MNIDTIGKPESDDGYFEKMCFVIFQAGLSRAMLERKWPGIRKAFCEFALETVSGFSPDNIEALLGNPDVIRNRTKINAIVKNAQEIDRLVIEFGSFELYLRSLWEKGDERFVREAVSARFKFMGKPTTVMFLVSVGEEMPLSLADCQIHH